MGISYNPSIVTNGLVLALDAGNAKSYDGRENLVSYSTYNASTWSNIFPANATLTTGISAPDGTNTAIRFSCTTTGNSLLRVSFPSFTPNGTDTYTTSFYVRLISGNTSSSGQLTSDLADGNPSGNYVPNLVANNWVRVSFTGVPTATAKTFIDLLSDNNNNYVLDFWGVQIEKNPNATTYTPTSGSTISRPTTWTDLSGNSNTGTLTNGPTYNSSNGGSIVFDGADDYVTNNNSSFTIANNLFADTNGSWSVSAWFKFPVSPTQSRSDALNAGNCSYSIFGRSGGIATGATFALFVAGTSTAFGTNPNKCVAAIRGTNTPISNTLVNTNTWYNAVVTWNGSVAYGYLNASSPTTLTVGTATMQTYNIDIGNTASLNTPPTGYHNFEGSISNVQVYNRALRASEISQNFNTLRGRFGV